MSLFKEIKEVRKYFSAAKRAPGITFYSENGIYYQIFKGTIDALLDRSGHEILYITSDVNDPVWEIKNDRIKPFYIKKLIPAIFPFLNTQVVALTMTDLGHYHIKRSKNPINHIYFFHAINSIHMTYNRGAFDHYDTIFCVGPHHVEEIRKTEDLYRLPAKRLVNVGYSWLEEMERRYLELASLKKSKKNKILIAPSWNEGNILESCIDIILDKLLPLAYEIVVRPHPEFIKRQKEKVARLQRKYARHQNFLLETDSASFQNILESAVLITDWSGIGIEFAWAMGKPVIYIDTPKKIHNPEYERIAMVPLEVRLRERIGMVIQLSDCVYMDREVKKILEQQENKEALFQLRSEHIFNWGRAAEIGADYIIQYCQQKQV